MRRVAAAARGVASARLKCWSTTTSETWRVGTTPVAACGGHRARSCCPAMLPLLPCHLCTICSLQICSSLPLPWLASPTQLVLPPPTACSLVPALSAARLPASGRGGAFPLPDRGCTRHSGTRWLAPGSCLPAAQAAHCCCPALLRRSSSAAVGFSCAPHRWLTSRTFGRPPRQPATRLTWQSRLKPTHRCGWAAQLQCFPPLLRCLRPPCCWCCYVQPAGACMGGWAWRLLKQSRLKRPSAVP